MLISWREQDNCSKLCAIIMQISLQCSLMSFGVAVNRLKQLETLIKMLQREKLFMNEPIGWIFRFVCLWCC